MILYSHKAFLRLFGNTRPAYYSELPPAAEEQTPYRYSGLIGELKISSISKLPGNTGQFWVFGRLGEVCSDVALCSVFDSLVRHGGPTEASKRLFINKERIPPPTTIVHRLRPGSHVRLAISSVRRSFVTGEAVERRNWECIVWRILTIKSGGLLTGSGTYSVWPGQASKRASKHPVSTH